MCSTLPERLECPACKRRKGTGSFLRARTARQKKWGHFFPRQNARFDFKEPFTLYAAHLLFMKAPDVARAVVDRGLEVGIKRCPRRFKFVFAYFQARQIRVIELFCILDERRFSVLTHVFNDRADLVCEGVNIGAGALQNARFLLRCLSRSICKSRFSCLKSSKNCAR